MENELCYGEDMDAWTEYATKIVEGKAKTPNGHILNLPAELQNLIIDHLGYLDGIRLRQANM